MSKIHIFVKTARQSTREGAQGAQLALDRQVSTCSKTKVQRLAYWQVDLGKPYPVASIRANAGDGKLQYLEVYVDNNPNNTMGLCITYSNAKSTALLHCYQTMGGRYVTIKSIHEEALQLCEVKVFKCKEGFFGRNCESKCHCVGGKVCDPYTGSCGKTDCSPGWKGKDCQTGCDDGKFGAKCSQSCNCAAGEPCNKITGICPKDRGCAQDWYGATCQTQKPVVRAAPMMDPYTTKPDSVELQWLSCTDARDPTATLSYQIQYRQHKMHTSNTKWVDGPVHPNTPYDPSQRATVKKLKTNTHYFFRIVPMVQLKGIPKPIKGDASPEGGPFKTKCAVPEAPTIEFMNSTQDTHHGPQKIKLVVSWKGPSKQHVNCDNIKYFSIRYQRDGTKRWEKVLAKNDATSRAIEELDSNTKYHIEVVAINNEDLKSKSSVREVITALPYHSPQRYDRPDSGIIAGIIICFMLAAAILIAVFLYKRRKAKYHSVPDKEKMVETGFNNYKQIPADETKETLSQTGDSGVVDPSLTEDATPSSQGLEAVVEEDHSPPHTPINRRLKIDEIEAYIHKNKANDYEGFRKEYEEIPMGFIHKYDIGKKPENKHKNKFVNIIAYDHSRVLLNVIDEDPDSDYINANYIDGYKAPKAYIASQGCNKWTLQDMWRLVWHEGSGRIVMVTNLVENGKRKCEQYWPEGETKIYGDIKVEPLEIEHTSDFNIRTFNISKGEEVRNIKHFHYTAWPDHGVPKRASPIIAFRRKIKSYDETHGGPVVIHCSAGVGRTGTLIALDYLLEEAKDIGEVDIYTVVQQMRQNRVNMIQTVEQYIFVYDALLEALKAGNTAIPCSDFKSTYDRMSQVNPDTGKSQIQDQFETLQLMSPKVKAGDCQAGRHEDNAGKNRCQEVLPADRHRPYLMTRVDGTNDYINAVFLDGFKKRNAYIITQMPMPHTVIDFWRLVHEHNVGSVVMLNPMDDEDETYGQYWPDEEACECGPFIIEHITTDESNPDITFRQVKLEYEPKSPSLLPKKENKSRMIGQFQLNVWGKDEAQPTSRTALISLIELVDRWQLKSGNGPILIHCHTGVAQSGFYATLSCVCDKMKVDQEVDIFHAVKHLRFHRPQIILDLDQYKLCHEMVLEYMAEFDAYANFR